MGYKNFSKAIILILVLKDSYIFKIYRRKLLNKCYGIILHKQHLRDLLLKSTQNFSVTSKNWQAKKLECKLPGKRSGKFAWNTNPSEKTVSRYFALNLIILFFDFLPRVDITRPSLITMLVLSMVYTLRRPSQIRNRQSHCYALDLVTFSTVSRIIV